ncbi:hypothetical protein ACOME3_003738 [Neoechinorhynchus agilis]
MVSFILRTSQRYIHHVKVRLPTMEDYERAVSKEITNRWKNARAAYTPNLISPAINEREKAFCTWNTKEHIRILYQNDPDQWTIDALSDSFHLSKGKIKRILTSKWRPQSLADLTEHDLEAGTGNFTWQCTPKVSETDRSHPNYLSTKRQLLVSLKLIRK